MAAQAMAKGVRDAADKSEYSAKMRETLAPARAFAFDEDSKNNLTGLDNQKIITYDSTQLNDDGETVLTARIFVDEHSNGSFVSEMFICTSETYTSLSAFRQASSEFYGQIPSGGND